MVASRSRRLSSQCGRQACEGIDRTTDQARPVGARAEGAHAQLLEHNDPGAPPPTPPGAMTTTVPAWVGLALSPVRMRWLWRSRLPAHRFVRSGDRVIDRIDGEMAPNPGRQRQPVGVTSQPCHHHEPGTGPCAAVAHSPRIPGPRRRPVWFPGNRYPLNVFLPPAG